MESVTFNVNYTGYSISSVTVSDRLKTASIRIPLEPTQRVIRIVLLRLLYKVKVYFQRLSNDVGVRDFFFAVIVVYDGR